MGGVNCIQTFFAFLYFFYIYKVPKQEAVSDRLNPLSLGTMSACAYIKSLS